MTKGRKPLPTQVKKNRGTYQSCRGANNEMIPSRIDGIPKPPKILVKEAATLWNETVKELYELDMLHGVDLPLLAAYCQEMATYFECSAYIQDNGITYDDSYGNPHTRPEVVTQRNALDRALKLATQFGFTPSARTRIEAPVKKEEKDDLWGED